MEAVPRLPMISFELKVSPDRQPTDFGKLKQFIQDFYHEDPESYSGEIHKLETLRATAMRPLTDVSGCAVLKKYYCQLHFLQSRFPMGKDGAAAVNFTWKDAYTNMVSTVADIRYEMMSVLYNIGALHSVLGGGDTRTTSEGLKLACTHFQCAAWAFQHLKDSFPSVDNVDLVPDLLQFMYQVSLAQAQECILEKSMTDNRKATINAKVATQIVDYYNMALHALTHGGPDAGSILDTVGSKVVKSWKHYVKFKLTYYGVIALLYQGQQSEEQQKMGERLAYYQAACDKLREAEKLTKGLNHQEVIAEAISFTRDVVEGKRKAASNDNEYIYHEEVPDRDALPDIKGAALVKGIPFSVTDPDISGPDIFGRLVPMKAHEASSLYSEEKAKVLRKMGAAIDEMDQQLLAFMSSLQLQCVNAHLEPDRLPQDVVDRCAALSAKPEAIQNLVASMDKLSDIYQDVEAMLNEIMELIQNEDTEEKEYQEVMGSRPPSIVATDLTREANKYMEAHAKAAESNETLHKAMTQHIANLRLLQLPLAELASKIPFIGSLQLDQQPIVKEMQHLVGKVEEMKRQRTMLYTQLRESVCGDDITVQLVTRENDDLEVVFQEELQKHNKYVTLLEQNLAAQNNIIKALTDAYAQYAPVRKATMEVIRQRNLTLSALISSYDAYEDLIAKSGKGQEFYRKLETNVTKLLQRVKGTCKVQQEEREQILAKNGKTIPIKRKTSTDEDTPQILPSAGMGSGAPKLKDYLDNYRKDKTGVYPVPNAGGQLNELYYNPRNLSMSKSSGYPTDGVSSPYDSSQTWIPSVRPAPVGQEGTCPTTTQQDLKPESNYPGYTTSYPSVDGSKSYITDGTHYPQQYADQYAAYMSQYQQYPITSSPYHVPANYGKTDTPGFSRIPNNPPVNYPTNPQNSSLQGPLASNNVPYPSPAPSPVAQNYSTPNYDYKVPVTIGQGYVCPTTMTQSFSTSGYNSATICPGQNYQPPPTQNLNYPLPGGQNVPTNMQQTNSHHSSSNPQFYQTQNIPSVQNYPLSNASPQHSYNAQQGTNYQLPNTQFTSSYPSGTYQNPMPPYSQTSINQTALAVSKSVDPSMVNNFATVGNQTSITTTTYSIQSSLSQPTNVLSQEKVDGQQMYNPYQSMSQPNYQTPPVSQVGSQSGVSSVNATLQYSSYIPQMYTNYINNDQYRQSYTGGAVPWQQNNFDVKNGPVPNYYSENQYPNYSQMGTQAQLTSGATASYYTHAGQQGSYQMSASVAQPTSQAGQPTYTQGNYYSQPYGYQYTNGSTQNVTIVSPSATPKVLPIQEVTSQGQLTPQSPMTYMQSSNLNLKVTFSQEQGLAQKSNVDLLAGLDFSLSQDPLEPQQKTPASPAKSFTSSSSVLEEKMSAVTISDAKSTPVTSSIPASEQLTPKKVDESKSAVKFQLKDPFNDVDVLNQFVQEVEKFEKFVEGLSVKTLNGPTPLDIKWKELLDLQDKDSARQSISVARCYPVKNRFPDILPYDNSRVEMPSTKDDYINASFVRNITPNFPDFIVTQLPLTSTFGDFWTMVLEQQVELAVCLLSDSELEGCQYWPNERGVETEFGRVKVTLQSCNPCKHWVERILYVTDTRLSRTVVHLQFTDWPSSWFPTSPGPFLLLVCEALSVRSQQRGSGPCVVQCLASVGRSGVFLLAAAAICHIHAACTLPDLTPLAADITSCRKNALRDREHLKFGYQALLYYSQDLLMKRGILATRSSFEEKKKSHTRHPSEDFLLGPPKDVNQPNTSLEKKAMDDKSIESGASADAGGDPLSQLDPLWSLKRPK